MVITHGFNMDDDDLYPFQIRIRHDASWKTRPALPPKLRETSRKTPSWSLCTTSWHTWDFGALDTRVAITISRNFDSLRPESRPEDWVAGQEAER